MGTDPYQVFIRKHGLGPEADWIEQCLLEIASPEKQPDSVAGHLAPVTGRIAVLPYHLQYYRSVGLTAERRRSLSGWRLLYLAGLLLRSSFLFSSLLLGCLLFGSGGSSILVLAFLGSRRKAPVGETPTFVVHF